MSGGKPDRALRSLAEGYLVDFADGQSLIAEVERLRKSRRDHFAALAMQALIQSPHRVGEDIAAGAVEHADDLIAALDKDGEP